MMSNANSASIVSTQPTTGNNRQPSLRFKRVSIGFDGNQVLTDISFAVHTGEMIIVLGPSGSGKSILLKLANGLLRPDSGRIWVFGKEISSMPERDLYAFRSNIGIVFQESALFDSMSVRDNVAFRLREQNEDEEEIEKQVAESLRFVELEHAIDKFPAELSGGMKRRVAIARAIITQPKLLLYDSPTGGLDPITSGTIIELIMKQRDVYDSSALLVTHRLQDAFTLATHQFNRETNRMERMPDDGIVPNTSMMVLREGRIAFFGSLVDLLRTQDSYLQEFIE